MHFRNIKEQFNIGGLMLQKCWWLSDKIEICNPHVLNSSMHKEISGNTFEIEIILVQQSECKNLRDFVAAEIKLGSSAHIQTTTECHCYCQNVICCPSNIPNCKYMEAYNEITLFTFIAFKQQQNRRVLYIGILIKAQVTIIEKIKRERRYLPLFFPALVIV